MAGHVGGDQVGVRADASGQQDKDHHSPDKSFHAHISPNSVWHRAVPHSAELRNPCGGGSIILLRQRMVEEQYSRGSCSMTGQSRITVRPPDGNVAPVGVSCPVRSRSTSTRTACGRGRRARHIRSRYGARCRSDTGRRCACATGRRGDPTLARGERRRRPPGWSVCPALRPQRNGISSQ